MSLSKETAEVVARHLVMAGRLVDDDPTAALAHARAARAMAGRVGAVREANGLVAYAAGEWAEALTELRTARRISGDPSHLPVIADCERALGRPDRALAVTEDPQAGRLDPAARVELLIVASGARRDLGQAAAAAAALQVGALEGPVRPWTARLRYAYADALLESGREDEARAWFARTTEIDPDGETDAVDRLLELDGLAFDDDHLDADDLSPQGLADADAERTAVLASLAGRTAGQVPDDAPSDAEPAAIESVADESAAVEPTHESAEQAPPAWQPPFTGDDEMRLFE